MTDKPKSPSLVGHTVLLAGTTQVWSAPNGEVEKGIDGLYHADWRYLDSWQLQIKGDNPVWLRQHADSCQLISTAALRDLDDSTKDPKTLLFRHRTIEPGEVVERLCIENASSNHIQTIVTIEARLAFAPLFSVRAGKCRAIEPATGTSDGNAYHFESGQRRLSIYSDEKAQLLFENDALVQISWIVDILPRQKWQGTVRFLVEDHSATPMEPAHGSISSLTPFLSNKHADLQEWWTTASGDLDALRQRLVDVPESDYIAAGAPWYLTLFGRDSLWAARMLGTLDRQLVLGTLRALASRQATTVDVGAAGQPGKILHELRGNSHEVSRENLVFPPEYFGSIDSTLLWIIALGEVPLTDAELREFSPALMAALNWLSNWADADGDGFIEYDSTGNTGLANHGWKDSSDSVRFHDGRIASAPVALVEVQGYAYQAALTGAELLNRLGQANRWVEWAEALSKRFAESFWVERGGKRFPAMALDADKQPVDSLTSNIGHLLGTGLITRDEEQMIVDALMGNDMLSGFGIRTMSAADEGFWPLSYHNGSVWAHDNAIIISGMVKSGFIQEARKVAWQLLAAARAFDFRMPELYGGFARQTQPVPVPYPTSCFPQAWSAAAILPVAQALE